MRVKITEGTQKEELTTVSVNSGESMVEKKATTETIEDFSESQIKYDLVGELTIDTGLTRKTIINILAKINPIKFSMYQYNPEEFIRKVSNLINNEKATTVIDGITYHKTEQRYSNDIFTIIFYYINDIFTVSTLNIILFSFCEFCQFYCIIV